MKIELPKLASKFGLRFHVGEKIKVRDLKKLRKQMKARQTEQYIVFVRGKGQYRHPLQKTIETADEYLKRQKQYDDYNHSFGDRNSFSKTDRGATFMRIKEDHMKNSQLNLGYNVATAVDSEYIVAAMLSSEQSDNRTFIPMMEKLKWLGYTKPATDVGFESKENYTYCEGNGQMANHNAAQTKNTGRISANRRTYRMTLSVTATSVMRGIEYRRVLREEDRAKVRVSCRDDCVRMYRILRLSAQGKVHRERQQ